MFALYGLVMMGSYQRLLRHSSRKHPPLFSFKFPIYPHYEKYNEDIQFIDATGFSVMGVYIQLMVDCCQSAAPACVCLISLSMNGESYNIAIDYLALLATLLKAQLTKQG